MGLVIKREERPVPIKSVDYQSNSGPGCGVRLTRQPSRIATGRMTVAVGVYRPGGYELTQRMFPEDAKKFGQAMIDMAEEMGA